MKNQIDKAIAEIFTGYEDTPDLLDFKEEIAVNLTERVMDMKAKGVTEAEALKKALNDFGDVTEAADAMSRQKRREVIAGAYGRAIPLDKTHSIGYIICGLVLFFGIIICATAALRTGSLSRAITLLTPFLVLSAAGFVYLGLTQETRAEYPMSRKRALWYVLAVILITFGACVCGATVFSNAYIGEISGGILQFKLNAIQANPTRTLGLLIPFFLPGAALLAFLILTEKSRKKPWMQKLVETQMAKDMEIYDEKFGLLSGALWISALALFLLIGMLAGFKISWVIFFFAVAGQLVLQYYTMKSHDKK